MFSKLSKLLTLLAVITTLELCSGAQTNVYVSPRAVRQQAIHSGPEIIPGVDYTPNVKPSDYISRMSTIEPEQAATPTLQMVLTKGEDGTLVVESTGTAPAYSKDSLFYYPLIPPTREGILNYCNEDTKLIENLEQSLIFEVEPIIVSLPETEAKKVYEEVLSYLKSLCKSQFRKLNALRGTVSELNDSQITEELIIKAFTYAKENDILVTTAYMLAAHSTPFPIPGKSPEVPTKHSELVEYVKDQCLLVKTQGNFMDQNMGRIDKISVLYQRQHAQRTYYRLSENIRSELEVCKSVYDELVSSGAVSEGVYKTVSDQAARIDSINAGTLSLAYHLDKYSPVLPSWARDQTKDPFIVGTPEGYGVVMLEPSKDLEDFYSDVVLKRAEEGDKDAERALLVQRIAVSVLEHRERTTTHAASKFFTVLECRAINSLSKSTAIVDPNVDFSTNEVESDVETAGPATPVATPVTSTPVPRQVPGARRLAEVKIEPEKADEEEILEEIPEEISEEEAQEPCDRDPEVILEDLATGKLKYEPAQCSSLVCLAGPSCISNRDGSPRICYKPACVKKDCEHVAFYKVDCSEATCEHGNCRPGSCVGGKCQLGKCVGGRFQSGSCSSTKCVGCTTELPRVEGCDVKPPRCEEGACVPSRIRGAKCVKKEFLEDYHCAKGECTRQDCEVCGSSGCSGAAPDSEGCVAPTCVPGSCTTGSCNSGSCVPNAKPDDRCEHGSCTGGYCIGPKCSANEYDGFRCKGPECTPARCGACSGCTCTPASCTGCGCVPPRCVGGSCGKIQCCGCAPMRCRGVKFVPARIVGRDGRAVGSCQNSSCVGSDCCGYSSQSGPARPGIIGSGSSESRPITSTTTRTTSTRPVTRPVVTTTTTVPVTIRTTTRPVTTTTAVPVTVRTTTTTTSTRPTTTVPVTVRATTTTTSTRLTTISTTTSTARATTRPSSSTSSTSTTTSSTTTARVVTRPVSTTTRPVSSTAEATKPATFTSTRTTTAAVTERTGAVSARIAALSPRTPTSTTTMPTRFGRSLAEVPGPVFPESSRRASGPQSGRPESALSPKLDSLSKSPDSTPGSKPESMSGSSRPESAPTSSRPGSGVSSTKPESGKPCVCSCGSDSSKCGTLGCGSCNSGKESCNGCTSGCIIASGCTSSCCGGGVPQVSPTDAATDAEKNID
ncbi:secreted protein with cysteine rich repeats and a mucin like threonine rich repeat [Cryptosporidium ryanae]|uniref:secreted protein with cysteine rich repeats and a mucin like threonine rich repeat n=1 Tax=Cryptosporidium ryanae TaxID=515981 RepID=UPI00351A508C|nr:secreted protein with cysteine rich repeats and a mucin like threonine rich repeat [Cryptosporidium ryanae]